jgi:hypothetical protein
VARRNRHLWDLEAADHCSDQDLCRTRSHPSSDASRRASVRRYRHVGDAFRLAVRRAGLRGQGRLSLHSLRQGYARARLKTDAANREVLLAPAIVRLLREQWVASPFKSADDFVFTTRKGGGRDYRHVGDAFRLAVKRAGLRGQGRLSLHSLRHGYASLLIGRRLDVVFVSRQLGHANVTLSVYAHLFAQREHGEVARQALEASYTAMREAGRP